MILILQGFKFTEKNKIISDINIIQENINPINNIKRGPLLMKLKEISLNILYSFSSNLIEYSFRNILDSNLARSPNCLLKCKVNPASNAIKYL